MRIAVLLTLVLLVPAVAAFETGPPGSLDAPAPPASPEVAVAPGVAEARLWEAFGKAGVDDVLVGPTCLPFAGCVDLPLVVDEMGDNMSGDLRFPLDNTGVSFPAGKLTGKDALRFGGNAVCLQGVAREGCGDVSAVAAGFGLLGGGASGDLALAADPSVLQRRVAAVCAPGFSIRTIAEDGTVACERDDDTTYAAAFGLTLRDLTFAVDTAAIQARVGELCAEGSSIRAIALDGSVDCEADSDTTYAAGTGLQLDGTVFQVDTAAIQARVGGLCAEGSSIRAIALDGTVDCEADSDTTYTAGTGLQLDGTTFLVDTAAIQARVTGLCAEGSSLRSIALDGTVECEADNDTTYNAGTGLVLADGTFAVDTGAIQARVTGTCPVGNAIRAVSSTGGVTCDAGSGWRLGGNAGTNPNTQWLGTSDAQALEVRTNAMRALRVQPSGALDVGPYSVAQGRGSLALSGPSAGLSLVHRSHDPNQVGSTPRPYTLLNDGVLRLWLDGTEELLRISPGYGYAFGQNSVATGGHGTVAGGRENRATNSYAFIGGGQGNQVSGAWATIGGGGGERCTVVPGPEPVQVCVAEGNTASGQTSTIAGGRANRATGAYSSVGGGWLNNATANYGTVAGGRNNQATALWSGVGGGDANLASGEASTIGGGGFNVASGFRAVVGGGFDNDATGSHAVVGGGLVNLARGNWSALGGGRDNDATGNYSFVGGGHINAARGEGSVVAGGGESRADGLFAAVLGGWDNAADGEASAVVGGVQNVVPGYRAFLGGGFGNVVAGNHAAVAGGLINNASGERSAVGGGWDNLASGGHSAIGGGHGNEAAGFLSFVGGGRMNRALGSFSTVGGGGTNFDSIPEWGNIAAGTWATIGGGIANRAGEKAAAHSSTVAGGNSNNASANTATVGGGSNNRAGGEQATVAGGILNIADGRAAMVPGGRLNTANGNYSLAAGRGAQALHDGAFVWADGTNENGFASTGPNQVLVRAAGGVGVNTNAPASILHVGGGALTVGPYGIGNGAGAVHVTGALGELSFAKRTLASWPGGATPGNRFTWYNPDGTARLWTEGANDLVVVDTAGNLRLGTGTTGCLRDADGTVLAGTCSSDARLKEQVQDLPPALDALAALRPVRFGWNEEARGAYNLTGEDVGLLAQEVEQVLPELVVQDAQGYKAVEYGQLPMLLLKAVQELKAQNDDLAQQVAALRAQVPAGSP